MIVTVVFTLVFSETLQVVNAADATVNPDESIQTAIDQATSLILDKSFHHIMYRGSPTSSI